MAYKLLLTVLTDITERDECQHMPPEHRIISSLPLNLFHNMIHVIETGDCYDSPFQFRDN